jgi:hypothetical protein
MSAYSRPHLASDLDVEDSLVGLGLVSGAETASAATQEGGEEGC